MSPSSNHLPGVSGNEPIASEAPAPAPESKPPRLHGIWVVHCPCGWKTLRRLTPNGTQEPPKTCEACGKAAVDQKSVASEFPGLVKDQYPVAELDTSPSATACWIASYVDKRDQRVTELAAKQGVYLFQNKNNAYLVFKFKNASSVNYKDGQARCFNELEKMAGPVSYQRAMSWLRDNTPDLPDYLKRKS